MRHLILIAVAGLLVLPGCSSLKPSAPATAAPRQALWVDGLRAEPVSFEVMLDDLGSARVVYLGEYHTLARHHELQDGILAALAERGVALVLAMEQFEFMAQPALDRFKEGQSDLAGLIEESDWPQRWRGHTNYHALMRTARAHGIPVLALNARAETIRALLRSCRRKS